MSGLYLKRGPRGGRSVGAFYRTYNLGLRLGLEGSWIVLQELGRNKKGKAKQKVQTK